MSRDSLYSWIVTHTRYSIPLGRISSFSVKRRCDAVLRHLKSNSEVRLCDLYAVYESPLINFRIHEPICLKLGMYTMAPEPISTAYFRNLSISLCAVCVSSTIAARQRLGRHIAVATNTHNRLIVGSVHLYTVRSIPPPTLKFWNDSNLRSCAW
jgi:hypothetical protein